MLEIVKWVFRYSFLDERKGREHMVGLDFERKHAEDLQRLRGFHFLDDDFMCKVFEDEMCVQFLLQIILNRKDLDVKKVYVQYDVKNLQGRSIRLDITAIDGNGRVYNIALFERGCERSGSHV